ncbi:MAG: sulfotransferase domain-containing protein [Eudoraea sp.]|nr:sulfotransferase domain-containing protein [Eudoraea sp.]
MPENKPDNFIFIIGAMKSGTTSLFEILSQHPQVCPSNIKEPDYFTRDNSENSLENYISLWNWQDDLHTIALESSVAYTKLPFIPGVPERIHKSNLGRYRFIYMLRNPLTRIESQVRHGLFAGWAKSLDTGIPEDVISFSSYAMQLDEYLEFFPIDNILLVTLEEFKFDPNAVLSRICKFLKIDNNFKFKDVEKTRNSGDFFNTSASISRLTQSRFGQFIAHKLLPSNIKSWLRDLAANLNRGKKKTLGLGRWKLTSEERNLVLNRLSEDLKRLESDFGIDIQKYWHIKTDTLNKLD